MPVNNSVSTADKALKDASGNVITETYLQNTTKATENSLGLVKVGDNVSVDTDGTVSIATAGTYTAPAQGEDDENIYGVVSVGANITNTNGVISLSGSNVTNALGYTPLDSAEISAATTAQIDSLFE